MTIAEALAGIDALKPNSFTAAQKIAWLSELDGMVWQELILTHERPAGQTDWQPYSSITATTTELLVPAPYDQIYTYWLASKNDVFNLEYDKFGNDQTMFNNAYLTYSDYYTRQNMPIQQVQQFSL